MNLASEQSLQTITPETLKQWLEEKTVAIADVREPGEYASDRIPGAHLVPLSQFDPAKVAALANKTTVVIYCQSGRRSAVAVEKLLAAGVKPICELQGGLSAWKQAGYATEANRNAPISLFRQVQIMAGLLVFLGTILGATVSPWFLILSGFVGGGLVFAGVSGTCALGVLLAKLPYNRFAC